MKRGAFARAMLSKFAAPWIWTLSITIVAGLVMSVAMQDLRWILFVCFIVLVGAPVILANGYYGYGMKRECYVNVVPHSVLVTDTGLTVRLFTRSSAYAENEEEPQHAIDGEAETSKSEREEQPQLLREEYFDRSMIGRIEPLKDGAMIEIKKPNKGFIWISSEAYGDDETFAREMTALREISMTDEDA